MRRAPTRVTWSLNTSTTPLTGDFVFIYSRTERQPKNIFATVAKFKTDARVHGNGCGSG
ncbi:MAG: hypothetical protein ACLSHL_09890 [Alistipes communis]